MLEARLVLATMLQEYHLELVSSPSLDLRPSITARPKNPVWMQVHERDGTQWDVSEMEAEATAD